MHDCESARGTLQQLRTYSVSLESELSEEIDNFCAINNIYLDALANGTVDTAVLSLHKEKILEAALSESWLYSATAKTLYSYLTDTLFSEYTPLPEDVPEEKTVKAKADISGMFNPVLKVYPNPSKGLVFIEYDFGKSCEAGYDILFEAVGKVRSQSCDKGMVNIYTVDGKLLKSEDLEAEKGLKHIDIGSLPNGVYILEVSDCYGNASSEKITKQ
jgi:hypothetical protein